jgi:hypothetical protein
MRRLFFALGQADIVASGGADWAYRWDDAADGILSEFPPSIAFGAIF